MGFWPASAARSSAALSITFLSRTASPRPILITIFSSRGTCMALAYSKRWDSAEMISLLYCSRNLAITAP